MFAFVKLSRFLTAELPTVILRTIFDAGLLMHPVFENKFVSELHFTFRFGLVASHLVLTSFLNLFHMYKFGQFTLGHDGW